jgi:Ca2+-binding RTX toxin-like protein
MALIVGTPGNDSPLFGTPEDDEIYGDTNGTLDGVGGRDRIFGRGGVDLIAGDAATIGADGRGGNDLIHGGDGDDEIYGDALVELFGTGGNDTLFQNAGTGLLVGDASAFAPGATGGNDRLFGTGILIGDSVLDIVSAFGGDDFLDARSSTEGSVLHGDSEGGLFGTAVGGDDTLLGGAFDDQLIGEAPGTLDDHARGGDDRLEGKGGDDVLYGDAAFGVFGDASGGDDDLRGGAGNDVIYGDAPRLGGSAVGGDDRIRGGGGDDQLWGDGLLFDGATGGNDLFFFCGDFGNDTVNDFRQGEDKLVFRGLKPSEVAITQESGDTILTTLGDDSVTLVGFAGTLALGVDMIFA